MFVLAKPEPKICELIPAQGDRPPVVVTFNPQPTPLSLRAGRRAAAAVLREGGPDAEELAGDAFSAAVIRHNIISWSGIGDAEGQPIMPTPDIEHRDAEGTVTSVEPGTITFFMSEPRLVDAADREYVLPWALRDTEGNGSSASPSGTGEAETRAAGIATSRATSPQPASGAKSARTAPRKPRPTKAKRSGS